MVGSLLAESRIVVGANAGRVPDAPFLIHHRIVCCCFAVPDRIGAPVGRGRHRVFLRGRRRWITHRMHHLARGACHRVEARHQVRAVLWGAVNLAVGVDARIAPVGRNFIVQVGGWMAPIPQRDDDIALDALRPLGFGRGQLAGSDSIGPIPEHLERALGVELADVARHERHGSARLQAPRPCFRRVLELAELLGDRARPRSAKRMA